MTELPQDPTHLSGRAHPTQSGVNGQWSGSERRGDLFRAALAAAMAEAETKPVAGPETAAVRSNVLAPTNRTSAAADRATVPSQTSHVPSKTRPRPADSTNDLFTSIGKLRGWQSEKQPQASEPTATIVSRPKNTKVNAFQAEAKRGQESADHLTQLDRQTSRRAKAVAPSASEAPRRFDGATTKPDETRLHHALASKYGRTDHVLKRSADHGAAAAILSPSQAKPGSRIGAETGMVQAEPAAALAAFLSHRAQPGERSNAMPNAVGGRKPPAESFASAKVDRSVKHAVKPDNAAQMMPAEFEVTIIRRENHLPPVNRLSSGRVLNETFAPRSTELASLKSGPPEATGVITQQIKNTIVANDQADLQGARAEPRSAPSLSPTPTHPVKVVELALQPASLGALTVTMRLTSNGLRVTINASTREAAARLEDERNDITELFSHSGHEVEDVTIAYRPKILAGRATLKSPQ